MRKRVVPPLRSGFTLVELLVVIAIIGILVALLLPAVQAARESARQVQCRNNLKQLAVAAITHESIFHYFPTGGWGWGWVGDPSHGTGMGQPGGWVYNVMPYLDQINLHNSQLGLTGVPLANAAWQMLETPLVMINCPSRRPLTLYPTWMTSASNFCSTQFASVSVPTTQSPAPQPILVAKTDYACNAGDTVREPGTEWSDPGSVASYNGDAGPGRYADGITPSGMQQWITFSTPGSAAYEDGVIYEASIVTAAKITDGLSNTYLFGEKHLMVDNYFDGGDPGDNENAYMGFNEDIGRWGGPNVGSSPRQDVPGDQDENNFGSAHSTGFNMCFCDGSVKMISFSIDLTTHGLLCNRCDGLPVDPTKY